MNTFKTILILLLIVLFQRTIAQTKLDTITAFKASKLIGQQVIVKAKVATVYYAEKLNGKPTYFNLDKKFPNNPMAVIINQTELTKLKINANDYKGKTIIVKGKVIEVPYENGKKSCLKIYNNSQIKIIDEGQEVIEGVDL